MEPRKTHNRHSTMSLHRLAPFTLALAVIATGCGTATAPPEEAPGEWSTQTLKAKVGADYAPILATSGDDALVLTVSEKATLLSHLSTDGADFTTGSPLKTDLRFVQLNDVVALPDGGWFTLGSGGAVERNGDEEMTFEPIAFQSIDGLQWDRVEVSGFDQPVDINDLEVVGDTIVAAGSFRGAEDPGMGGFEAHLWTSTDGESFSQVDLPDVPESRGYRTESYAGHLAVVGDRVLAAGRVGRTATLWASDDSAATWQRVNSPVIDKADDISGLAVVGEQVLAGIGEGKVTALHSKDAGATWVKVDSLPVGGEEAGWAPVWSDGSRFWTLTGVDDMSWSEPEVCYADLDQCGKSPDPAVVTSQDGATWTAVELPGELDQIAGTADGRALTLAVDRRGVVVRTLPAGSAPPQSSTPVEPKRVKLITLGEDEKPEIGTRYHAPLYVHCGMDWFWFGDATYRRTDDGPDVETGAGDGPQKGWPLVGETLYGYAVAVDEDTVEYSTGDEVIATYERAKAAPGCM